MNRIEEIKQTINMVADEQISGKCAGCKLVKDNADLLAALEEKDRYITEIAEKLGCHRAFISNTIADLQAEEKRYV